MKKELILVVAFWLMIASLGVNLLPQDKPSLGATILFPQGGGTGIGSATAGDVGKFLALTDDSPLTYALQSAAAGSQTPWTSNISGANYSLSNVGSLSATSSVIGQMTFTNATGTGLYVSASSTFQDLHVGTLGVTGHTNMTSASSTGILTIHEICNEAGECWDSPTPAGSVVTFYPKNTAADVATYEDMLSVPSQGLSIDESCTADADVTGGYCTIDTYISTTTDTTITNYPAGTTIINAYTYSSATAGNTYLVFDGFKRTSAGVETWLGQATTTDINATVITDYMASFTGSSDFAFSSDGTDRLVWKVRAWTDSSAGRVVHFTYQSTSHYSRMATPIQVADRGYVKSFNNETITGIWKFINGLISNASSTMQTLNAGTLTMPSLTSGGLAVNSSGLVYKSATTTFSTGLTYSNGNVVCDTASASVAGCISTATFATFNSKVATGTAVTTGQIPYWLSGGTLGSVATGTISGTYPLSATAARYAIGGDVAISIAFGTTTANTWSALNTFNGASTTALTASTFFQLPNGTTQSPTLAGACGFDTTSGQLKCGNGTATLVMGDGYQYPAFSYSTSTAWTASTTLYLGTAFTAETWSSVQCVTDTGTVNVTFSDGTNSMNMFNASTTVGTVTLSTNNTFTAAEKRQVIIGTPASTPTKIGCTVKKSLTAD